MVYQFLVNEMAHPFITAGIQGGYSREHRHRDRQTLSVGYDVPAVDERSSDFVVRPFVSVGAKSYFNRQTFVPRAHLKQPATSN